MKKTNSMVKGLIVQGLFFIVILLTVGFAVHNVSIQLAARGISSGFDFLKNQAGFGISFHLIPYAETSSLGRVFLVGAVNTLFISVISIVLASIIGLLIALARLSSLPVLKAIGFAYVETLRNVPLLLQFFVWYFAVLRQLPMPLESWHFGKYVFLNIRGLYIPFPQDLSAVWIVIAALLVGLIVGHFLRSKARTIRMENGHFPRWHLVPFVVPLLVPFVALVYLRSRVQFETPFLEGFNYSGGAQVIPELIAAIAALSLYTAAFIAEIIRGAIQAVSGHQREAALALGMRPRQVLARIVFPQALGHIIPPLTSQYLNLIKNSSLAAAIAFPELVLLFAGTSLNVSGQAVEIMAMTLGFYLVVSLSVSALINLYQARALRYERA
ncbi:MAG: ABC transporter permease subunit [Chitinophagaceae bacterium]|nr:ABC transporter permease subunit [Oligoflexus sp.]